MSRNPDIQRLLANLRGAINVDNRQLSEHSISRQPVASSSAITDATFGSDQPSHDGRDLNSTQLHQVYSTKQEPSRDRSSTPNIPDASNITTWPSAVKFISKYIAPNDKLEAKIKRLITNQHKHERDWWQQRQNIIKTQAGRTGNQQKAADLLRSLGGNYVPATPSDPSTDLAELEAFDLKVHKSLKQLATHYDSELKQMGIPFFAIKHNLVVLDDGKQKADASNGQLNQVQLKDLQKRVLVYLEELFGDETPPT